MLVLSRNVNERIRIGDDIEVKIIEVRGDRVKLGFSAPLDVPIHREEIYQRIVAKEAKSSVHFSQPERAAG